MLARCMASVETEYALSVLGEEVAPSSIERAFSQAVAEDLQGVRAASGGRFLVNGARLYLDVGLHPEYACPECVGPPEQLVAHIHAGHRIMSRVADGITRRLGNGKTRVWHHNLDYGTRQTWGCHENHLTRKPAEVLAQTLVPFLVTRAVYGGAGGLNAASHGIEFSLSPRLQTFTCVLGSQTTSARPIVNTRDEAHAVRHRRLHLICRDSLASQFGDALLLGVTRLVVRLADMGVAMEQGLELKHPIAALQAVCADPTCSTPLEMAVGKPKTALDIQRRYALRIREHLAQLPDWAPATVDRLDDVLARLAEDPAQLAGLLDWPTKLMLFDEQLRDAVDGAAGAIARDPDQGAGPIGAFNRLMRAVGQQLTEGTSEDRRGPSGDPFRVGLDHDLIRTRASPAQVAAAGGWPVVEQLLEQRLGLIRLDMALADVDSNPFDGLPPGAPCRVVDAVEIEKAMTQPPPDTRAAVRGRAIESVRGKQSAMADWTWVGTNRRVLDLRNPFEMDAGWSRRSGDAAGEQRRRRLWRRGE